MSSLSNRARVYKMTLDYINDVANTHCQTIPNMQILHTIAEGFISSTGIDLAEQYLDINKASGEWLDDVAKTVGVDRSIFQGTPQFADDTFFRTYIKFVIIRNFSRASLLSLSRMLFVLFGNKVYITRQETPFTIGIFADEENYDILKVLIQKKLLPLALCHSANLLGQSAPEGFEWWGIFTLPYSVVIEGKMTEAEYLDILAHEKQAQWQPKDGGEQYLYITEELIFRT